MFTKLLFAFWKVSSWLNAKIYYCFSPPSPPPTSSQLKKLSSVTLSNCIYQGICRQNKHNNELETKIQSPNFQLISSLFKTSYFEKDTLSTKNKHSNEVETRIQSLNFQAFLHIIHVNMFLKSLWDIKILNLETKWNIA